jgi:hypothetical protein
VHESAIYVTGSISGRRTSLSNWSGKATGGSGDEGIVAVASMMAVDVNAGVSVIVGVDVDGTGAAEQAAIINERSRKTTNLFITADI